VFAAISDARACGVKVASIVMGRVLKRQLSAFLETGNFELAVMTLLTGDVAEQQLAAKPGASTIAQCANCEKSQVTMQTSLLQYLFSDIFAAKADVARATVVMTLLHKHRATLLAPEFTAVVLQVMQTLEPIGTHRDVEHWSALRNAFKSQGELMKHFVNLPYGKTVVSAIDSLLVQMKKDGMAADKIKCIICDLSSPHTESIRASRDATRTSKQPG
jgi:hypothetical protein